MSSSRRPTLDDFYQSLQRTDFGPRLPAFDQLPRPSVLDDPLLAHMPYVLFVVDFKEQAFHYMSPSSAEVMGYPPEFFLQGGVRASLERTHPDDQAGVAQFAHDYFQVRARLAPEQLPTHHWTLSRRMLRPDGSVYWFFTQYVPLYITESHRVLFALGTGFDVTASYRLSKPVGTLAYLEANGQRVVVPLPLRVPGPDDLTARELEVLRWVGRGHTSEQIAERLFIAKSTVDTHRRNILSKTGLSNSVELTNHALTLGLV